MSLVHIAQTKIARNIESLVPNLIKKVRKRQAKIMFYRELKLCGRVEMGESHMENNLKNISCYLKLQHDWLVREKRI